MHFLKIVFKEHPYSQKIIGEKKVVETYTVEDALYFFKTYYAPNNYMIILSGDVKVNHSLRLIKEYFGDMKPSKIPSYSLPKASIQKRAVSKTIKHHNAKSKMLYVGYKGPIGDNVDAAPMLLVSAILGDGNGAILKKKLVDAGLASSLNVYYGAYRTSGYFIVEVGLTSKASKKRVLSIINKSIRDLKKGKIAAKEIARAKNWLLLDTYKTINSNRGLANFLGSAMGSSQSNNYMRAFEIMDQVQETGTQDIKRVSSYYLNNNKSNVVLTKPMGKK